MVGIYLGSPKAFAGKNLAAMSIGLQLQSEGHNVGYMKPLGERPQTIEDITGDEDAIIIQEVLGQTASPDVVTPVIIPKNLRAASLPGSHNCMEQVTQAYASLARQHEIMLVGGLGSMHTGKHRGVDGMSVARELGLKTILVDRFTNTLHYDAILSIKEELGDDLLGVLFNDVPEEYIRDARNILVPFLKKHDVDVFGMVPRYPLLNAIKASELAWQLGGRIVSGNAQNQRIVENFIIGTMQVENFMGYFRSKQHAATIVGGDRTDLQLVALEGNSPCLILTGNMTPSELVRSRSEQKGIPVIEVAEDTYTVAKRMERILGSQKLRELVKIREGAKLVNSVFDFPLLLQKLHELGVPHPK